MAAFINRLCATIESKVGHKVASSEANLALLSTKGNRWKFGSLSSLWRKVGTFHQHFKHSYLSLKHRCFVLFECQTSMFWNLGCFGVLRYPVSQRMSLLSQNLPRQSCSSRSNLARSWKKHVCWKFWPLCSLLAKDRCFWQKWCSKWTFWLTLWGALKKELTLTKDVACLR